MAEINWGLLQQPDIAGSFQQGLEHGQKRRQEEQRTNALAAYSKNPDDPVALNSLMQFDPRLGMQIKQSQQQQADQQQERQSQFNAQEVEQKQQGLEMIGRAAQAADTEEKWDATVDLLVQNGYAGAAQFRGQFAQREAVLGSIEKERTGEKERLIAMWEKETDPQMRERIDRAIGQIQYTQPVMQAQTEQRIAVKTATPGKAPSSGGGGGGGGGGGRPLTATARANYLSDAHAAIAKGADPAKVNARLRELGVQ